MLNCHSFYMLHTCYILFAICLHYIRYNASALVACNSRLRASFSKVAGAPDCTGVPPLLVDRDYTVEEEAAAFTFAEIGERPGWGTYSA